MRGNSNVEWESDAESDCSSRLDYSSHYDSDDNLIANSMLPIFASGGGEEKKPKKKGKGKRLPAPEKKLALATTSLGGSSKLPVGDFGPKQQTKMKSEEIFIYKDGNIDLSHEAAMGMVATAYIKAIAGHFTKLYSKIDNLKCKVKTLKTTMKSLVEENKKLGEVKGENTLDPEKQPPVTPVTPTKNLMISPALPPAVTAQGYK